MVLQKASTLSCNDLELRGDFRDTISAMSGSVFAGRFPGNVTGVLATTGASIHWLGGGQDLLGPVTATHGGLVSLPDRTVFSK